MLAMYVQVKSSVNDLSLFVADCTSKIIFAAILERIFFHVYPSFLSLLGTSVILSCAIYVAVRDAA